MRAPLALLAASVVLLAGCGDDTAGPAATPSENVTSLDPVETSEAPSPVPDCSTVWKAGVRLSLDYVGCLDAEGSLAHEDGTYCESGQMIFTNGKDMYAAAGRKIMQVSVSLKKDAVYQRALRSCRG
jgi:hypothetical protein